MFCEMIDTTNSKFDYKIGEQGDCEIGGGMWWMGDFHTSYITSLELEEDSKVKVSTRNSTYVFKILDGSTIEPFSLAKASIKNNEERISSFVN